ncbi:hypothetical protein STRTUCAR8_08529 [Streptomyces turgidiscabies Car8]|uniref:Uncharacterized protein n=1 Tax=Streptomyces turgidiscabies (strain Car8) TaxID=698760 RepID=L7F9G7_STRT8|nr:hypothetical protein [Streptomyces turgidiscabies]ELP67681.1 hypothetical protein STRTUCAR8_08529 [Streptomyces turgidiscabies Car8]
MTETTPLLDQEEQEDTVILALKALLFKQSTQPRDKAALRALIEEETLLARENVRRALIVTNDQGTPVGCAWDRVAKERFGLGLDEEQRIFLDVILSVAGPHHVNLGWLMEVGDRRLGILLRAMTEMAGNNTIAIGTKL